jgi:hypothetical protein
MVMGVGGGEGVPREGLVALRVVGGKIRVEQELVFRARVGAGIVVSVAAAEEREARFEVGERILGAQGRRGGDEV